jgi:NTP pyrophosphatase (non-canonical NTP hydrolase)
MVIAPSKSIAERIRDEADLCPDWEQRKSLRAIASELEEISERTKAHASHWRQPYQRFCYEVADSLAKRKEP